MCTQNLFVKPTSRGVRIWLEGPRNTDHGFTIGARYDRALLDGVITFTLNPAGRYKMAGKADRPIIDYSAKQIKGFSTNQAITATYSMGKILIMGSWS